MADCTTARVIRLGLLSVVSLTAATNAQDENPLRPDRDSFHTTVQAHALLEAWNERFPQLTHLYSIGETLDGTPLMVLEITNEATGPANEKPGYYYDSNIHAGELTGAEVALHFAGEDSDGTTTATARSPRSNDTAGTKKSCRARASVYKATTHGYTSSSARRRAA